MKKLNLKGKLSLNKQVVSILSTEELRKIQGGDSQTCVCPTVITDSCQVCSANTCTTCTDNCGSAAC